MTFCPEFAFINPMGFHVLRFNHTYQSNINFDFALKEIKNILKHLKIR